MSGAKQRARPALIRLARPSYGRGLVGAGVGVTLRGATLKPWLVEVPGQ